mmetsp:Transcript_61859/g.165431  ORF Transcript_61859/g.165431 Transcript_61859/m.165431 type:complete len:203 (+) Transcript_61859:353-961(+)
MRWARSQAHLSSVLHYPDPAAARLRLHHYQNQSRPCSTKRQWHHHRHHHHRHRHHHHQSCLPPTLARPHRHRVLHLQRRPPQTQRAMVACLLPPDVRRPHQAHTKKGAQTARQPPARSGHAGSLLHWSRSSSGWPCTPEHRPAAWPGAKCPKDVPWPASADWRTAAPALPPATTLGPRALPGRAVLQPGRTPPSQEPLAAAA